jgi:hypothetical protein
MVHRASLQKSHQYKIAEASVKTARELQAKFVGENAPRSASEN